MSIETQAKAPEEHDFSFGSGERQISEKLSGIRADHRSRYEFGISALAAPGFGLDVFCGNGYGSFMISETGHHVLGVDGSEESVSFANRTYATDSTLFAHKVWPFSIPTDRFDFVFCLESLEHISDYRAFFSTVAKALKKGGKLVLSTPNEELFPFQTFICEAI